MATTVDAKLLKSTKFPAEFNQKVDMQKVNLEVMKKWIAGKISEILGNEDDVVIELCLNLIEGSRYPDIKKLQIQLTGFLEKDTPKFCQELWKLCLSAQSNAQGVPKELLEAKKLELIQEKIASEKAAEDARLRRQVEQNRDREMASIRERDRGDRGRAAGRGDWRGNRGRGGRDFDGGRDNFGDRDYNRRGPRYSRSPRRGNSRERSFREAPAGRETDSYIPRGRGRGAPRRDDPRRRSPSFSPRHSRSRSRSLPNHRRREIPSGSASSPRRRRRSTSRSASPKRDQRSQKSRGDSGRHPGRKATNDRRRRSYSTSSNNTKSPSPKPRRRRHHSTDSESASPPPRRRWNTSSVSGSRTPSRERNERQAPARRGRGGDDPNSGDMDIIKSGNIARKGRDRDERRLTRSNSGERDLTPPRRRHRSRSRSRSRSGTRHRKRRGSIQRYEPASKRKRNTPSDSSHSDTRNKRADSSEDDRRSNARNASSRVQQDDSDVEMSTEADQPSFVHPQTQTATELRERLLREKIKQMRTTS